MAEYEQHTHTFPPVFDHHSKILILGTFPSVKSREQQFYYGHPQNRFWKVLAYIAKEPVPTTIEEKKYLLLTTLPCGMSFRAAKSSVLPTAASET